MKNNKKLADEFLIGEDMPCEICGRDEEKYIIVVEGAKLKVCEECSSLGKIIWEAPKSATTPQAQSFFKPKEEIDIVEGYGEIIASARKKLGLPIEVLAERINEKVSFLERIEKEKTKPNEKVARKLEKELGIKLFETIIESSAQSSSLSKKELTLGDIIEIKKKNKK